jgi:hypothetical protein
MEWKLQTILQIHLFESLLDDQQQVSTNLMVYHNTTTASMNDGKEYWNSVQEEEVEIGMDSSGYTED